MKRKIRGLYVARIFGIPITLDYSWFLIFGLIAWSLSGGYFADLLPGVHGPVHWILGIGAALLLFLSILLHELAHALIARARGIPIRGITLHVFGGVAEMKQEVEDPKSEIKMAAAGPATSVAIGLLFGLLTLLSDSVFLRAMFGYLFYINLLLAAFNLIPGFPLDGGRILRAILWIYTEDMYKATRWASRAGTLIAYLFMAYGFILMLSGFMFGGIWFVFIGFFLMHATESNYKMLMLKRGLTGMKVENLMVRNVNSVSPGMPVHELIDAYILKKRHHSFPVLENGNPIGIVTLHDVKEIPREEWSSKTVRDIMTPLDSDLTICSRCDLSDAFTKAASNGIGRLVVLDETNRFAGYISFRDLETLVTLKLRET
ncbi:site-2 protease family protein [bacterium]|nr:site-2 protease family protein [candidate division CSSED10-310 bacterium]